MVPRDPLAVKASIQQTTKGRYTLKLLANGQTRKLEGNSCTKVAEAAALLIALLLDPSLTIDAERRDAPTRKPEASNAKATSTESTSVADDARPAPPQRSHAEPTPIGPTSPTGAVNPLAGLVELAARLDIGSWPKLEPAIMAGMGIEGSHWRLLAHAGLGRRVTLAAERSSTIELIPFTFDIEPAIKLTFGQWSLEPGVGAELGITHSHSAELEPRTHDAVSMVLLALLRGTREIGLGLRAWAGLGAGLPLLRPRWVGQNGELYHAFGPTIRGEFGLQLRF